MVVNTKGRGSLLGVLKERVVCPIPIESGWDKGLTGIRCDVGGPGRFSNFLRNKISLRLRAWYWHRIIQKSILMGHLRLFLILGRGLVPRSL